MTVETISVIVSSITFRDEESGYSVFSGYFEDDPEKSVKVQATSDAKPGQKIVATGIWANSKWGRQFKAQSVTASLPVTREGLISYLSCGIIKGVGAGMAAKIVDKFGTETIDILNDAPDRMSEIKGVGAKKIENIKTGWAENQIVNRIMLFLHSNNVPTGQAWRIYKTYGKEAFEKITENPYQLTADVRGIGFKNADKIAMNLGVPRESMQRARAAVGYVLDENKSKGHCGMVFSELVNLTSSTLDITTGLVQEAVKMELAVSDRPKIKHVKEVDGDFIYLAKLHDYEAVIATKLANMAKRPVPWTIPSDEKLESIIDQAAKDAGIELAEQQRAAVKTALTSRVMVLTGGPGTGKTSVLKCILAAYRLLKIKFVLAAPTGKAARRMKESTGVDASTLHRLFKLGQGNDTSDAGLSTDVLVVDESSMMDVPLKFAVLDGMPQGGCLVLVGDIDQLPSVGPGSILGDIIESGIVPTVRLTKIFRQAAGSKIIQNAHLVNNGEMPIKGDRDSDFFFIQVSDQMIRDATGNDDPNMPIEPEEYAKYTASVVADLVKRRLPAKYGFNPKTDIQVLCPMNGGIAGTVNLNQMVQHAVNPPQAPYAERMGVKYGIGDRVMQVVNNYDKLVFNGDTGVIKSVDIEEKKLVVRFEDLDVDYEFNELDELVLAYAMTIHKSQGSQFDAVVIPMLNQHYMMLARNLLYTGITRAKRLVVLVGQESAVRKAVKNDKTTKRVTRLKKLLTGEVITISRLPNITTPIPSPEKAAIDW